MMKRKQIIFRAMYSEELQNQNPAGDELNILKQRLADLKEKLRSLTLEDELEQSFRDPHSEPYSQDPFFDWQGLCP